MRPFSKDRPFARPGGETGSTEIAADRPDRADAVPTPAASRKLVLIDNSRSARRARVVDGGRPCECGPGATDTGDPLLEGSALLDAMLHPGAPGRRRPGPRDIA